MAIKDSLLVLWPKYSPIVREGSRYQIGRIFGKLAKEGGSFSILKFMLQVLGTLNTDEQAQEAGPSGWSVARGRICVMIFCKWPDPPDDQAQEAGPSRWSVARGRILWIIICKWPVHPHNYLQKAGFPNDHLQEAGSFRWSGARGWILLQQ